MKRVKEISVGDAIDKWLREMQKQKPIYQARVVNQWADYVGVLAARKTKKICFEGDVLVVHLDSSVVRRELEYIKKPLIERINKEAHERLVCDIRFNS